MLAFNIIVTWVPAILTWQWPRFAQVCTLSLLLVYNIGVCPMLFSPI